MQNLTKYIARKILYFPVTITQRISGSIQYLVEMYKYSHLSGAEHIHLSNLYPCLLERTQTTSINPHYFFQSVWAAKRIFKSECLTHIDVGSYVPFVGFLTCFTKVIFIDIRPLEVTLNNLECQRGTILQLPFASDSVSSLSCLHVAEHIGLGRYGDDLDPYGTHKAMKELSRILKPGGFLYLSVPIGKPRICFNAHRIFSSNQILDYLSPLRLVEFSGVNDSGIFRENIKVDSLDGCSYGCGFFLFTKP